MYVYRTNDQSYQFYYFVPQNLLRVSPHLKYTYALEVPKFPSRALISRVESGLQHAAAYTVVAKFGIFGYMLAKKDV